MTATTPEALRRRPARPVEVRGRTRPRRRRMRSWIVFSLAVVAAFFGLIFSRISLDRSAFVLEDLERQIDAAQAHRSELRVEVARLQSPARISSLASDMGMVYPGELIVLDVPGEQDASSGSDTVWARPGPLPSALR